MARFERHHQAVESAPHIHGGFQGLSVHPENTIPLIVRQHTARRNDVDEFR